MIVCVSSGKDTYGNKSEVKRRAKFSRNSDVSIYRCSFCNGWHFGGTKPLDTRVKLKGRLHG